MWVASYWRTRWVASYWRTRLLQYDGRALVKLNHCAEVVRQPECVRLVDVREGELHVELTLPLPPDAQYQLEPVNSRGWRQPL